MIWVNFFNFVLAKMLACLVLSAHRVIPRMDQWSPDTHQLVGLQVQPPGDRF